MQTQKGFIVPAVIVVAVVAILGTAGYFVYKQYTNQIKQANIEDNQQNQTQSQQQTAQIKVVSPNGGENIALTPGVHSDYNVIWSISGIENLENYFVKLVLVKGETVLGNISNKSSFASNKTYNWGWIGIGNYLVSGTGEVKTATAGNDYKIKVELYKAGNPPLKVVEDYSDNYFSIVAADQTAGWKTYDEADFAFSFKYPAELGVYDNLTSNTCCLNITNYGKIKSGRGFLEKGDIKIQIANYKKSASVTLKDFVSQMTYMESEIKATSVQEVIIAGINGIKSNLIGDSTYYLPQSSTKGISITIFNHPESRENFEETVNQLLSTFKFTPVK